MHQQLRGGMVELVSPHGFNEANVVNMLCDVRQAVRDPLPALPSLLERIL